MFCVSVSWKVNGTGKFIPRLEHKNSQETLSGVRMNIISHKNINVSTNALR